MTTPKIRLGRFDIVEGRAFTDPDHNASDLASMQYLADSLRRLLCETVIPTHPRPYVLHLGEPGGRRHRVALVRPEALVTCPSPAVVGFCGTARPGADRAPLYAVDAELLDELVLHPHLLSYSSLEVEGGNWRNLVVFSDPQGISAWALSAKHTRAAQVLSPACYLNVRLHNGFLPGGLLSGNAIVLVRTKYYDFEGSSPWWAIREMTPDPDDGEFSAR